jgi:hypothetical protein
MFCASTEGIFMQRQELLIESKEEKNPGLTNTKTSYSLIKNTIQTRNSGEIVSVSDVLDDTEGLAAMDTLPFENGSRNLDIGGGRFDESSKHILKWYGVTNLVYDPYGRSEEHNSNVIGEVKKDPVDSVTSNSVLNVVLDEKERGAHITLAYDSLKSGGVAFFKVWRENNNSIPDPEKSQSNKEARHYVGEIQGIFGRDNVELIRDDIGNTIFAYKK